MKTTLKKTIIFVLILAALFAALPTQAAAVQHPGIRVTVTHNQKRYTARVYHFGRLVASYNFKKRPKIVYTTTDRLTYKQLTHRKNKTLLIEVVTGRITDADYNGRVDTRSEYNYINYRTCKGWAYPGDRIRTYLIYNPSNNYEDDIIFRCDQGM